MNPVGQDAVTITRIGGPTALLEWAGVRLLTDPTFDPADTSYPTPVYTLHKRTGPALAADALGRLDAVLLSHDHHFDNLDHAGRLLLSRVPCVLAPTAAAARLGGTARGLEPWQDFELAGQAGGLRVTATPARHGPPQLDRGPVIGFVLERGDRPGRAVYLSGDTVWYEGVAEVARRWPIAVALLFMGAARVEAAGPWPLTMTAEDGVEAARALGDAIIVPIHFEGWDHFSESRDDIAAAFARAGLGSRLRWTEPGKPLPLPL
jgi:L-ascorbate metabolism protein UlaG (beta-lactamase superfamily)